MIQGWSVTRRGNAWNESVARRNCFHTSLWCLHDVFAKFLIQFLHQMLFLYWVIERGFVLSQQDNNFKSAFKQRWSSNFIKVILAMTFRRKLKLTQWRGYNVDKTTFEERWHYLLHGFPLDSGSIATLSYVLQQSIYISFFNLKSNYSEKRQGRTYVKKMYDFYKISNMKLIENIACKVLCIDKACV